MMRISAPRAIAGLALLVANASADIHTQRARARAMQARTNEADDPDVVAAPTPFTAHASWEGAADISLLHVCLLGVERFPCGSQVYRHASRQVHV